MKKILTLTFLTVLMTTAFGQVQEETLKEVEVIGLHFKYLSAIDQMEDPTVVQELHNHVGNFDVLASNVYDVEVENYQLTFEIPQGKILAGYDNAGNLLWTVEKFRDLKLPYDIARRLTETYPGWNLDKTFYTISYNENDVMSKKYKLIISKDGKKKRVLIEPEPDVL